MDNVGEDLRTRMFNFLWEMSAGSKFPIKNDEQLELIKEFISLHGYEACVELNADYTIVKKFKFLKHYGKEDFERTD